MANMIRSVEEIIDISESKRTPNKLAYRYIINKVDKLLRTRAIDQQYDATFEVPGMILYQPSFDRSVVTKKIVGHYRKIGFQCDMECFQIVIRWGKMVQESNSETESDNDSEEEKSELSGLYKKEMKDDLSDEEKLPSRKIVVEGSGPSLSSRVSSMKKK